jgi:hypothetical protein
MGMRSSFNSSSQAGLFITNAKLGATSMKKHVGFWTVSFLLMSSLSNAQDRCPEGFRYAGALSGTSAETFDKTVSLKLPEFATLDESFQQTAVRATNGKKNAKSNLRPQDIPKGIYITPSGSSDLEKIWAVSEPQLKTDNTGGSTRYAFGMHLFCAVQGSPYSQTEGSCEVGVEVCYKPKSRN